MLELNIAAPDFSLYATLDHKVSLNQLKGKNVILAFYPADWSPVCSDQMALYNEMLKFFDKYNAVVLGISVDGRWCHVAFSHDRNLHFPLLADFEPKGAVARMYDVYDDEAGECKRALYVIDDMGMVRWRYLSPAGVNPGAEGIFEALEEITGKKS